ncbi:MAG: hypothetical protein KBT36_12960 [Kurthia sp.]|nr:hypothetical protein [Candidatus Kurthia equi]
MGKSIDIEILKNTFDEVVESFREQLEGNLQPKIYKEDALRKLGALSEVVLTLYDKVEDDELKEQIWKLKESSDNMYQQLMGY